MAQLFDEQGNVVEALTPEEVEEKLNQARAEAIEEANAERQAEIDAVTAQVTEKEEALKTAQEDLQKEKDKDKNLGGQRRVIEEKEKKVEELTTLVNTLKSDFDKKIADIQSSDKRKTIDNMIDRVADGDKVMADKIKFYFDSFRSIDETGKKPEDVIKEIEERIKNAYTLAAGTKPANPVGSTIISSAGPGATPVINPTGEKLSPELVDLAHKLGTSDAELKKHKLI